jgi:hypothetical protein
LGIAGVIKMVSKSEKGILVRKRLEEASKKKKPAKKETTEVKKEEPKKSKLAE